MDEKDEDEIYVEESPPVSGVPLGVGGKQAAELLDKIIDVKPFIRNTVTNKIIEGDVDAESFEYFQGLLKHVSMAVYNPNQVKAQEYLRRYIMLLQNRAARNRGFDYKIKDSAKVYSTGGIFSAKLSLGKNVKGENIFDKIKTSHVEQRQEVISGEFRKPRPFERDRRY